MALHTHELISSRGSKTYFTSYKRDDILKRTIMRLNGEDRSFLILTQLPRPCWSDDLTKDDLDEMGKHYIQCAGSSQGLTIEIRKPVNGEPILYRIGKGGDRDGDPDRSITYSNGKYAIEVYPDEVFTPEETVELFYHYAETRDVPDDLSLREHAL